MKFLTKALFIYCLTVSLFIFISGMTTVKNNQELIFQLLFIPILAYFIIGLYKVLTKKHNYLPEISLDNNTGQVIIALIIFITLFVLGMVRIISK